MKDSFVFHFDWVEDLPEEFREPFTLRAVAYAMYGTEPDVSGLERTVWLKIKRQIDDDTARYEDKCAKRSAAGKKGGRPKKAETAEPSAAPAQTASACETEEQETDEPVQAEAVTEKAPEVSAQSVTPVAEQKAAVQPVSPATVSEAWCVSRGYFYDAETYQRIDARTSGLDVPDYLAFCEQKIKAQYAGKSADEMRVLFRDALLKWDSLRFDYTSHLELLKKEAQAKADSRKREATKPKLCPDCGKPLDMTDWQTPKCTCGFYSLEAGAWTWNKKADAAQFFANAFMKSYGLQPAAQLPPRQPQPMAAGAEQFDIF